MHLRKLDLFYFNCVRKCTLNMSAYITHINLKLDVHTQIYFYRQSIAVLLHIYFYRQSVAVLLHIYKIYNVLKLLRLRVIILT